ncbi:hypothetical protein RRG08_024595 [Elysia crispata]|uniref:Uncharacterized protein n=1 Tax=Elysia crispata TaxID=231223 RepID=A0AAE1DPD7_9GAST|nr:hypothetical protein RRG08_024595 [Elysia crispata]
MRCVKTSLPNIWRLSEQAGERQGKSKRMLCVLWFQVKTYVSIICDGGWVVRVCALPCLAPPYSQQLGHRVRKYRASSERHDFPSNPRPYPVYKMNTSLQSPTSSSYCACVIK